MDRKTLSLTRIQLGESKRRYAAHFISKLTDADGENPGGIKAEKRFHWAGSETDTWLDFARYCKYISIEDHGRLTTECKEVGAMLGAMIKKPERFLIKEV